MANDEQSRYWNDQAGPRWVAMQEALDAQLEAYGARAADAAAVGSGDRVLDVGCGFGALGRAIMDDPACPPGVTVQGLERVVREGTRIPVTGYDGAAMPYDDGAFDVVILADVLHHEADPERLLAESARVARRRLVVKDHVLEGFLARPRVCFIDWAANAPYGVPCRYEYNTLAGWRALLQRHGLALEHEQTSMRLYPPLLNLLFGRRLHYLAVLRTDGAGARL